VKLKKEKDTIKNKLKSVGTIVKLVVSANLKSSKLNLSKSKMID
jgi:hypothetical protein